MTSDAVTVLIVEDLKMAQLTALSIFEKLNCQVDISASASSAFEHLLEKRFDIAFIDIHLPDMNGFEIATTIRDMQRHTRLPLVAVTANSNEELAAKSKSCGFDDYLIKPLTIESIRHMLFKHINKML